MTESDTHDRGVSEVLGFILLFSIVILSIGTVSIFGVNALNDGHDAALMDNMERGFEGMAYTIDDLEPGLSRATSLQLRDGQLSMGNPTTVKVSVGGNTVVDNSISPIVYTFDGEQLIYVSSALFRVSSDGAVVVREPQYKLSESGTIISIRNTIPSRAMSMGGGTAQLRLIAEQPNAPTIDSGAPIEIDIDAPSETQAQLWESALEERLVRGGMSKSTAESTCTRPSSQHVDCDYGVNSGEDILVRSVLIRVSIS